uniref:WD repeatcontaining protein 18like [Oreochromis niloticus] n=1 Tax=Lepeophtheirus salmonis TaxID=72036 RepID=A0A0K2T3S6_LEPSM
MNVRRNEVLVTGDDYGAQWNLAVWDPSNGTSLVTYKGGTSIPGSFNILGSSYVVSVLKNKAVLNVWRLDRHEQLPQKITTPGKLKALSANPNDGRFLVGSVAESIYLWQTNTGRLLNILVRHYQEVNRLAWTDDGSFILSAGKDGALIAWSLSEVMCPSESTKEPYHIWNDSALEITDLVVGKGGPRARIFTCSYDQHVRVYDLPSASLLLEVTFSKPLTSIAVDSSEVWIYLGSSKGDIHTFSLRDTPCKSDSIKTMISPSQKNSFLGHSLPISCLSISIDGSTLASGSEDKDVRIWDVKSRQTLRIISMKGLVTIATFLSPPPRGMLDHEDFLQDLNLCQLEKNIGSNDNYTLKVSTPYGFEDSFLEDDTLSPIPYAAKSESSNINNNDKEVERLKKINMSLYQSAVELILNK